MPALTDQVIGTGDGVTTVFQLVKAYSSGAQTWTRTITKPVSGTVSVALDGIAQASGWSVDTTTGLVTFTTAPASGIDVTHDLVRLGSITSIPLIVVRR